MLLYFYATCIAVVAATPIAQIMPTYVCPPGSHLLNGICAQTSCPSTHYLQNGACYLKVEAGSAVSITNPCQSTSSPCPIVGQPCPTTTTSCQTACQKTTTSCQTACPTTTTSCPTACPTATTPCPTACPTGSAACTTACTTSTTPCPTACPTTTTSCPTACPTATSPCPTACPTGSASCTTACPMATTPCPTACPTGSASCSTATALIRVVTQQCQPGISPCQPVPNCQTVCPCPPVTPACQSTSCNNVVCPCQQPPCRNDVDPTPTPTIRPTDPPTTTPRILPDIKCPSGTILINRMCHLIYCGSGIYREGKCIQTLCPEGSVWTGSRCELPTPQNHTTLHISNIVTTNVNQNDINRGINFTNNMAIYITESPIEIGTLPPPTFSTRPTPTAPPENCCFVVTPHTCSWENNRIACQSRKYRRCGSFCTRTNGYIYLTPPNVDPLPPPLPPPEPCMTNDCGNRYDHRPFYPDCSGCDNMSDASCWTYCQRRECRTRRCESIDLRGYCGNYPRSIGCRQVDGCMQDWCHE